MSSSPLERLQRRFVRSATFAVDPDLVAGVTGGGTLTAAQAVDVYRGGYTARLTEALGETYEACWRALGDEAFFAAACGYIARTPSLSYNLSDYGATFPDFLESLPDAARAPFLGDLARFEWTFKELFHAPAHAGLSAAALAAAVRPAASLRLGGAVRLLSLRHRAHALWKRDRADDTPLSPSDWEGAERLVLYKRGGNDVFIRALNAPEHRALKALSEGVSIENALAEAEGLDAAGAQALFAFVAESGIVAEVR
jgi:hypothetical protein